MKTQSIKLQIYTTQANKLNTNSEAKTVPSFDGYTFNPHTTRTLANINPLRYYFDKIFRKTMNLAKLRQKAVSEDLQSTIQEITIPMKKYNMLTWDITDGTREKYVLFLHGTGQNISHFQEMYRGILSQTDYAVLAPEFRGFGKNNDMKISTKTLFEDAKEAFKYLVKDKGIKKENICILGHSLGCSPATKLANKYPDTRELILLSPINSFKEDVDIKQALGKKVPNYVMKLFNKIGFLSRQFEKLYGVGEIIKKTKMPVSIVHSKKDTLVNPISSIKIAEKCPNLKSLNMLEDGSHIVDSGKINILTCLLKIAG